jgi:galactonate dehydratase
MKIVRVTGYPVMSGIRCQFVVEIETDTGIVGLGEGGISGRELAMQGMLDHFATQLIGQDPRRIEHIWQQLYRGAYFEGGTVLAATVSAVDIALWDILGKHLGVPVWQLLGGATRDRIPCFISPGVLSGPEVIDRARAAVDAGWNVLRFGPGMLDPHWQAVDGAVYDPMESLALAADLLREIRDAVGPRVALAIDFHHRLSPAEAAVFCQRVEPLGLYFVEEPIRCENPDAYAQLRAMTNVPFAIGEEYSSKWAFAPYIERGLTNFARIDVCNVGGLTESKKVAAMAEAHYIDVMPHNPLGPISTAACIHLAASINNFATLEYTPRHDTGRDRDLFPVAHEIDGAAFPLPTEPGLGVTFDPEAAKDHPFEYWSPPRLFRDDGSYTNW